VLAACGQAPDAPIVVSGPMNDLQIYTVNYPLAYMAERIGGEHASVIFPAPADVDPAFWRPGPEDILAYQGADLILLNGAGYAKWLALASLPSAGMVDTSVAFSDQLIAVAANVRHKHGPEGGHSHGDVAFTTWLDPNLAIAQAHVVTNELIELAPTSEKLFRDNLANLQQDLMQLDSQLAKAVARLDGKPVLFSHPVYQYLQRRYGINGESVHWEPGEEPTTSDWIALQRILVTHPVTIMIWEDAPMSSTAERLSNASIAIVPFRTASNRPEEGDYFGVMRDNVERLGIAR